MLLKAYMLKISTNTSIFKPIFAGFFLGKRKENFGFGTKDLVLKKKNLILAIGL